MNECNENHLHFYDFPNGELTSFASVDNLWVLNIVRAGMSNWRAACGPLVFLPADNYFKLELP
jgi:hypothetical protein